MSQAPVSGVHGPTQISTDRAEFANSPDGTFALYDNGEFGYKPDGKTSLADVMNVALLRQSEQPGGKELQPFVGDPAAGFAAAKFVLNSNPQYAGVNPNGALPAGKDPVEGDLKAVAQFFLKQLGGIDGVRSWAAASGGNDNAGGGGLDATSGHSKATGKVYSRGLGLPIDR